MSPPAPLGDTADGTLRSLSSHSCRVVNICVPFFSLPGAVLLEGLKPAAGEHLYLFFKRFFRCFLKPVGEILDTRTQQIRFTRISNCL